MSKGAATREAILDVALAQSSADGLEALSIGSLAQAVGLSKSGLFAHFGSKEGLQLAVLRTARDRFVAEVVSPALREPRGEPRLRALLDRWLVWAQSSFLPGGCPFVAASAELDDRPGPARDFLAQSQRDWLDALAHAARIAVAEGHFESDLDAEQLVFELYGAALGFHQFQRLLGDPRAERRCRQAFDALIERSKPTPPRGTPARRRGGSAGSRPVRARRAR